VYFFYALISVVTDTLESDIEHSGNRSEWEAAGAKDIKFTVYTSVAFTQNLCGPMDRMPISYRRRILVSFHLKGIPSFCSKRASQYKPKCVKWR